VQNLNEYQIRDLALGEHRWRIDWFGAVTYAERYRRKSQPLIEVQLSQLPSDLHDLNQLFSLGHDRWPKTRQARLPVGFLSWLRIGDIWKDGRLIESPAYDSECFHDLHIDRGTTSIIKAGLSEDENRLFYLPLSHHPYHVRHTQSYCILINSSDHKIVIPAVELIRFYFGSSSNLISRIFDVPFSPENFWRNVEPGEYGNKPTIHLASGLSGRSATDIGRIAFSKSARAAVELIGNSCIAATANQQSAYPKAIFPFEGTTDLVASGKWLPFDTNERGVFIVFKLISCSHPFPFTGLHYTSERKGSSNTQAEAFSSTPEHLSSFRDRRFVKALKAIREIVNREPGRSKIARELESQARPQFPDLEWKRISKIDPAEVPTIMSSLKGVSIVSGSSVGEDGQDTKIQPIDVVNVAAASSIPYGSRTSIYELSTAVFLDLTAKLLASGKFVSVDFVRLSSRQRFDYLSTMPLIIDEDGEISSSCLVTLSNDLENQQIKTCHRRISVGRALELHASHFFMVPELSSTGENSSQEIELHLITDISKSIRSNDDLHAAIASHFMSCTKPGKSTVLGVGVESMWHCEILENGVVPISATVSDRLYQTFLSHLSSTNSQPDRPRI
jgi:hypothetical protein